jgi:glucosamine--fructose-6-phosphate aminotransferase (isomerizing)
MCGIIGYIGNRDPRLEVLRGLEKLEYRGYDSAGLAHVGPRGRMHVVRSEGRVASLRRKVDTQGSAARGEASAVGHTRWATHGVPAERNAHPHVDCSGRLAVVHNGIVENHDELRRELELAGHRFSSETDTEVIAHLFEALDDGDPVATMRRVMGRVRGQLAVAIVRSGGSEIVAARRGSPLIVGCGHDEFFVASDPVAILERTRNVIYLDDDDIVLIGSDGFKCFDAAGNLVERSAHRIEWERGAAERGGYAHFMRKEIQEQPRAVARVLRGRTALNRDRVVHLPALDRLWSEVGVPRRVTVNACGTSLHAGMVGRHLLQSWCGIPVEIDCASELRHRDVGWSDDDLVVSVSQSGETADTLAVLDRALGGSVPTLSIVNVVGSSIARRSLATLYTQAGPEIGVASTKAFTTQVVVLALVALALRERLHGTDNLVRAEVSALSEVPRLLPTILEQDEAIAAAARRFRDARAFAFLGRGLSYPVALEGALKLKEVTYIPASGYPAGEMKHGPIALIDERVPSVILSPTARTQTKMSSTAAEIRARRGPTFALAPASQNALLDAADARVVLPDAPELVQCLLAGVALQLFSYHLGCALGRDVDKPRNLAKSVTVE